MKTKRTNRKVIIVNIVSFILLIIPAFKLDLFYENYSTLSLNTKGYLYVLLLAILIGSILCYETYIISNNRNRSILIFFSLLIGTIIPHHVPYNLQGNLHLLFAYIGFAILIAITYINIVNQKYRNKFISTIIISILIYLKYGMVNTLSEIIVMTSCLFFNLYVYLKK